MATSERSNPVERLALEILDILLAVHYLRSQSYGDDPLANLRETKVMALLFNDVVLRLGKFRDDDNRTWSFRKAAKYLGKRVQSAPRAVAAKPLIAKFIERTKRLDDWRNLAIAHLPKRGASHLEPVTDLLIIVSLAVKIVDTLAGEENRYCVGTVDLRSGLPVIEDV